MTFYYLFPFKYVSIDRYLYAFLEYTEILISACIIESANLGSNVPRSAPTYVAIMRTKGFDFWAHVENWRTKKETFGHYKLFSGFVSSAGWNWYIGKCS